MDSGHALDREELLSISRFGTEAQAGGCSHLTQGGNLSGQGAIPRQPPIRNLKRTSLIGPLTFPSGTDDCNPQSAKGLDCIVIP